MGRPGMIYTPEQITYVADRMKSPVPGHDAHWWRVDLGVGAKPGWLYAGKSAPRPSDECVAAELTGLSQRLGPALEARMTSPRGMLFTLPQPGKD